jgi:hypothetical protein
MVKIGLSELRLAYLLAVDDWIKAIRAQAALATTDHSMTAMELWDSAHFKEQEAQAKAKVARDAYTDGLRNINYGI